MFVFLCVFAMLGIVRCVFWGVVLQGLNLFVCACRVFVCLLICFVSVCGGCEVLGDVVWCVVRCVFCCACVCFYVCVVSDVLCDVCVVCVVRVSVCACGG